MHICLNLGISYRFQPSAEKTPKEATDADFISYRGQATTKTERKAPERFGAFQFEKIIASGNIVQLLAFLAEKIHIAVILVSNV